MQRRGVSLVEVLCTSFLLLIVVAVGASLLTTASRTLSQSRAQDQLIQAATEGLERLRKELAQARRIDSLTPEIRGQNAAGTFAYRCNTAQHTLERQTGGGPWVVLGRGVLALTARRLSGGGVALQLLVEHGQQPQTLTSQVACWVAP